MPASHLRIGEILKPQGLNGQVKIKPLTDDPARFLTLDHVYFEENGQFVRLPADHAAVRGEFAYLRVGDARDRDGAEAQRGKILYIDRESAAALAEGANYIADLIGCDVVGTDGASIGVLRDVLKPGANDVYVIQTATGEMLLPALMIVVPRVDVEARQIVVDQALLPRFAVWQDE